MTDIVERLNDIWANDDHERGCQGREYSCSCGFDNRTAKTAEDAATEITRLRQLLSEAEAEVTRYRVALIAAKTRMRNCRGAIESNQVIDKDVHGSLQNGIRDIQGALASIGGEHHGN